MINDFVEYWAAAKLLMTGGNPYSPEQLLLLQQSVGWSQTAPLIMWNPPWTLFFIAPLGLLDYGNAQFFWFLLHSVIIFVGGRTLWQTYDGVRRKSWWTAVAVLTFAPTYLVLFLGQIGALILLGLILFLCAVDKQAWVTAGLCVSLVSVKPHLLYLFWLVLVFWVMRRRRWRFLGGWLAGAFVTGAAPVTFDPSIYARYLALIKTGDVIRPFDWATPSLGTALATFFSIAGGWIHWSPSFAGALWLTWYWRKNAQVWEWRKHLGTVLLVSVTTASFAWTFDQIVLLPAVLQVAAWMSRRKIPLGSRSIIFAHLLINGGLILLKVFVPNDFWYFWVAPTYLLLFLYARWGLARLHEC
jgi:Glycosyltransferase family 87